MTSWISRLVHSRQQGPTANTSLAEDLSSFDSAKRRRVVEARVDESTASICFLMDRAVLPGLSFWCPDQDTACANSPLAAALFNLAETETALLHEMTVTVTLAPGTPEESLEACAREGGTAIRRHIEADLPAVHPEVVDAIPPAETIRARLQQVIDEMVNPGISAHSGVVALERVVGNTAYILMGGGCQGCAAAAITLRQGIEAHFREAAPQLGAVLDATDHGAGTNPFFRELPKGWEV